LYVCMKGLTIVEMNLEHLKALAQLARENDLAEITISEGDKQITIKTPASVSHTIHQVSGGMPSAVGMPTQASQVAMAQPATPAPQVASAPQVDSSLHTITSPMVGTFYAAASPDAEAFAPKGFQIKSGQPLCILEAMKQMNELESDVSGTIVDVLIQDGQPVEYGQALFTVKLA
jgi:acetyl-CoA carboxylase biotin carboxyl carrier protein